MSEYFDRKSGELLSLRDKGATYTELYAFDQSLVRDIGVDVSLRHTDPACDFPDDLKVKVYALFWKYSFVVNPDQDETELKPQAVMMHYLVEGLHTIYHERAQRGHPFGDFVSLGLDTLIMKFCDAAKPSPEGAGS